MITDPMRIRFCMEKALYLAYAGRPGPVWLDVPLNVQAAMVETEDLTGFDPADYEAGGTGWAKKSEAEIPMDTAGQGEYRALLPKKVEKETAREIIKKIRAARRPVINAGNGIRIAGAHEVFIRVAEALQIPVVTERTALTASGTSTRCTPEKAETWETGRATLPSRTAICCFPWEAV